MFDPTHGNRGRSRERSHHRDSRPGPHNAFWFRELLEPFRGGRPALRRGDVRPLILAALGVKAMHGYQVIQELEARSGGRWRPSAGSVYPTLQQLEDEGLVRSEEIEGRRTYSLTDEGRAAVAASPAGPEPWDRAGVVAEAIDVRGLALQLVGAVMQVSKMGSPQAKREARDILVDARKQMYRLLAEDEEPAPTPSASQADSANAGSPDTPDR